MLKNYIKIALRNLKRFKVYSIINLLGLALGFAVSLMILMFIVDELGYDTFHKKGDRLYRVITETDGGYMETNAWPVATILKEKYPEVEQVVYSTRASSNMMVSYEGKDYPHEIFYAGNEFFQMFSFPFIEGNPNSALQKPFTIVITEAMKQRYFGNGIVLGKTITLRDTLEFEITGVVENIPSQSHIQFDMIASFKTYEKLVSWFSYSEGWGNFNVRNYVLLKENVDTKAFQSKISGIYNDHVGEWLSEMGISAEVGLEPLNKIYLESSTGNGFGPNGSLDKVYLLGGVAIFVLLLACINFINLTTARSVYRAKEVGVRKVVGSSRTIIVGQFMSEAFLLTLMSFIVGLIILDLALPLFNELLEKHYELSSLFQVKVILGGFTILLIVTLLSGYYPSVVLSGYHPAEVLKGNAHTSTKGVTLRRTLVVFQFFISGLLVLGTLTIIRQLDFMRNQDLGFDKDQVLVLDVTRVGNDASFKAFQTALNQLPDVEYVSFTNALPGRPGWLGQWAYPEKTDAERQVTTEYMAVDEHYLDVLGLELIAGENFDPDKNMEDALVVNETTVREMGWESPLDAIGKKIVSPSQRPAGTVIGVVKDFHGLGLQDEIWPQAMDYDAVSYGRYYAMKFSTGNTSQLLKNTEELWSKYLGDSTFEYSFLDDDFDKQYRSEDRLMTVFIVFALLTLIIAAIGLLGLVSFLVLSKLKEIGIRKVLGANTISLVSLLSREFVILVIIANILVIPVVIYFGGQWLNEFAYHTQISPLIFLIATASSLLLAMAIVSMQTIHAAKTNPINTLRND